MDKSVSIIVPAYNEEKNLPQAVADLLSVMKQYRPGFEIVIVDDGSTDATGVVADRFARKHRQIRVIHHTKNEGFGAAFRSGITHARKTWVVPFHGDNDSAAGSLRAMIDRIGEADIISAYTANTQVRSILRRIISRLYIVIMNTLFGLSLRYYTGYFITRRSVLENLNLVASGLSVYAETKIRLLAVGYSMIEVPFVHTGRKHGISKAIGFTTAMDAIRMFYILFRDIGFRRVGKHLPRSTFT